VNKWGYAKNGLFICIMGVIGGVDKEVSILCVLAALQMGVEKFKRKITFKEDQAVMADHLPDTKRERG
jgi:hypothetical protein